MSTLTVNPPATDDLTTLCHTVPVPDLITENAAFRLTFTGITRRNTEKKATDISDGSAAVPCLQWEGLVRLDHLQLGKHLFTKFYTDAFKVHDIQPLCRDPEGFYRIVSVGIHGNKLHKVIHHKESLRSRGLVDILAYKIMESLAIQMKTLPDQSTHVHLAPLKIWEDSLVGALIRFHEIDYTEI